MTIIDRYLLLLFIKIFLICFVSFSGLFVVIHLFTNLDEISAMKSIIGWKGLLFQFYAPRVAEIFERTSAVWMLIAAVFTVSLIERRREMTAIEAAGVRRSRILLPVFCFCLVIVLLGIVNRECGLPLMRDNLVRSAQTWLKQQNLPMNTFYDLTTGIKIRGAEVSLIDNRISRIEVQLPVHKDLTVTHIQAEYAFYSSGSATQLEGLKLHGIKFPAELDGLTSNQAGGVQIFWPSDTSWLKSDECYVVCKFDPYQAAFGPSLQNYQSVPEMMADLRKPRAWYGNRSQINLHARFIRPLLDMTLLLIGLPLVVHRKEKNVFVASVLCFGVIAVFVLTVMASHALGDYSILQPPVLAAWLPAIIFFPVAVLTTRSIDH
jgi:lipopolysaccharide export system permease protein